ncbi:unnamed protein product [Ixodes pacificus]
MNPTATKVKRFLAEIEATAETILADKEQLVELDRRRQKNREAIRCLQNPMDDSRRPWVCIGNMFMKIPKARTKELLVQGERQSHTCEQRVTPAHYRPKTRDRRSGVLTAFRSTKQKVVYAIVRLSLAPFSMQIVTFHA